MWLSQVPFLKEPVNSFIPHLILCATGFFKYAQHFFSLVFFPDWKKSFLLTLPECHPITFTILPVQLQDFSQIYPMFSEVGEQDFTQLLKISTHGFMWWINNALLFFTDPFCIPYVGLGWWKDDAMQKVSVSS